MLITWDVENPPPKRNGPAGPPGTPGTTATVSVGATTTGAPGSNASVVNSGTSSAAVFDFTIPQGSKGDTGDTGDAGANGADGEAATIEVGAVTTISPDEPATVTNVGTSAAAIFDFEIPKGGKGEKGEKGDNGTNGTNGSAATVSVGTTTTGLPGSNASVTNAGTSATAVLNFTIPRGDKGDKGDQGDQGPAGPNVVSSPVAVSPAFGAAYAATVPTKPSFISAMIDTAYTVTVATTVADTVELRIGPNQSQVAAGTGGFVAATFRSSVTGIALAIGLGMGQRGQLTALLPTGWFWSLRRTQGTTATITSATDQSLG